MAYLRNFCWEAPQICISIGFGFGCVLVLASVLLLVLVLAFWWALACVGIGLGICTIWAPPQSDPTHGTHKEKSFVLWSCEQSYVF